MQNVKFIILGAGPAGLSVANRLLQRGESSFVVFEKESEAGGLCRSRQVDGAPLDIGGGHFLDIKRPSVLQFLWGFLPRDEWVRHQRKSTIRIHGQEIDYPFEANLWQLPIEKQVDYLESIARAGCNVGEPMPASFIDWIGWKLGARIGQDYMLPYNRKIWCIDLDRLGTYWLHKLPNVSFRDTLRSCLEQKQTGSIPAHGMFDYPRFGGYGEVWRRMGAALGDRLLLGRPPRRIDPAACTVDAEFRAGQIITTVPWPEWLQLAELPAEIERLIGTLETASVEVAYHSCRGQCNGDAHWIYDPDESVSYHRILNRYTFCPGARGYWTETNVRRAAPHQGWRHVNAYAYPLNLIGKPEAVEQIRRWASRHRIVSLGRWGEWEHMNSDVAVERGLAVADALLDAGPQG